MSENAKKFRVHVGYTSNGRNRWRYFPSADAARPFLSDVFNRTGVVLSVTRTSAGGKRERQGWFFYSDGEFVENLDRITQVLGSHLYEVLSEGGENFVRRVQD